MFRGTFEHTVDEKGRVSVPAKFRDLVTAANDDRVVVTNFKSGDIRCLDVYLYAAWMRLEERIRDQPQFDPSLDSFQQYYIARAHDCQVDKQGRILLPPVLREYARLGRVVTFTGQGEKFRIWDSEGWHQHVFARAEATVFEDPNFLRQLKL